MTYGYAKVVADSISEHGIRLFSAECRMRRFVLSELNTHTSLTKNSASSRAIPVKKQMERIVEDLAYPEVWPLEKPGMQGGEQLPMPLQLDSREDWRNASQDALKWAQRLLDRGVHKSVTNRLLEPFMWHTVLITGTAWENFFDLRCNPLAQPEIRVAAEHLQEIYRQSEPELVTEGFWHLPYVSAEEKDELSVRTCVEISSARSARLSYLTQGGVREISEDLGLYERLTSAKPMHASPMGHVATPNPANVITTVIEDRFDAHETLEITVPIYGNLLGWHQHRMDLDARSGYGAFR